MKLIFYLIVPIVILLLYIIIVVCSYCYCYCYYYISIVLSYYINIIYNIIILNDYYVSDLNTYQSGKIRYPLNELPEGNHTLTLKVWDVQNNSSSSYTDFVVANQADLALTHILNYPNPFTTKTKFFIRESVSDKTLEENSDSKCSFSKLI